MQLITSQDNISVFSLNLTRLLDRAVGFWAYSNALSTIACKILNILSDRQRPNQ